MESAGYRWQMEEVLLVEKTPFSLLKKNALLFKILSLLDENSSAYIPI